jgi:hypothetical protein
LFARCACRGANTATEIADDCAPAFAAFGKPTITTKKTFQVKHLHHKAALCAAIDLGAESVDNRVSAAP